MYAFLRLSLNEEATNFLTWIFKQCQENKLQLIYGVDGTTNLTEKELPHLAGYKNSKPVRIGNGAMDQLQIDIYGELIDTI
jgi:GH15 family glucan-1,4-alpha-glucosidase